ncbi:type II/IV secretion system protein [Candidatus Dojkabacteria bacterium]|uniref:Type II/IV secretion system protein n=1 Tax=Candidatus Dojkabacteria bacterium TaxID=2099670 RepID=A0A955KZZ4_9BACT|nr:type II/IV secretion system protein [Candidatus Dojkabacteria bacterium]
MNDTTAQTTPVLTGTDSSSLANTDNFNLQQNELVSKLIENGIVSKEKFDSAKVKALTSGKSIEDVLIQDRIVSSQDYYKIKSEIYNIPFINIAEKRIPVEILNIFSKDIAKKNQAVSFEETPDVVKVAMVDPLDLQKTRFLTTIIGKKIEPYFTDPVSIKTVIDTRYGAQISSEVDEALEDVADIIDVTGDGDFSNEDITSAPVAKIVNMILEYAVKHKASDVHIEPRESGIIVRYRMSGVLSEKLNFPKKLEKPVVARIKILSNLKIDEHRVPQDGRFQIKMDNHIVDIRVSIMPSVYGEKVVLRLLERGGNAISFDNTGIRGQAKEDFLLGLKKTQGIILVTGPTGSGKTVTLASSLMILNNPEVNIVTLEDPVEIRVEGITQIQINADIGLTFANGLRSVLRQDPDIVMVGEIRDQETARLAVQASLTGHLVLATLHTNNAAGAIPRLIDMGIEPFLLASTINVVAAQRLTRKICENCKMEYMASAEQIEEIEKVLSDVPGFDFTKLLRQNNNKLVLYKGKGCPECGDSGYRGRMGIFEAFSVDEDVMGLISDSAVANDIEKLAVKKGMITMVQDGYIKVLEGTTTIEEVLRVVN